MLDLAEAWIPYPLLVSFLYAWLWKSHPLHPAWALHVTDVRSGLFATLGSNETKSI